MASLVMLGITDVAVLRSASQTAEASFAPPLRWEAKEEELLEGAKDRVKRPFLFPGYRKFVEYAETPQLHCPEKRYFGGMENSEKIVDGDKAVCLSSLYNITPGNCLVYSFGIAGDWSFDDAMAEYGCQVYSFDPTIGLEDHQRSERVHFYNVGLGGANRTSLIDGVNATILTLGQIIDKLGHTNKTIDYLKMDIEAYEILAFTQLANEQYRLSFVKQVSLEIHPTKQYHEEIYTIMTMLDYLGFASFDARRNMHQELWYTHPRLQNLTLSCCYEIAWAQVDRKTW
ncbi:probable methyltransferase-like protein 24 [Penaeus chinensis]|uniref:probable methyltransferase-like protein 24 n=1 Tax=Penaeus chinensis TaxID=139456 RepID=UPI001FB74A5B|nr:probable methyltransferase-like protein 24 [Penaeus chinensis]